MKKNLKERIDSIHNYLDFNKDFINNMTDETAPMIYKEMKNILLKGNTFKLKRFVPKEFTPVTALLMFLFCGIAYADTKELILIPQYESRFIESNIKSEIKVELRLRVGENTFRHYLTLPREYSVTQALESVYSVKHGFVCFSAKDIQCINNLCGDGLSYWAIRVNGNEQNYSSQSHLTEGDVLELVYVQSGEPTHLSLDQWISSYTKK